MLNENIKYVYHLLYPSLTVMISCVDENKTPNLITVAWLTPLSIDPPLIGIAVGYKRYSYTLISRTKEFVICVPPFELVEKVLRIGRVSGKDVNKFAKFNLKPKKSKVVSPPSVDECIANIECIVEKEVNTGDHALFVGRVVAFTYDKRFFNQKNKMLPIPNEIRPILHLGGNKFCTINDKSVIDIDLS